MGCRKKIDFPIFSTDGAICFTSKHKISALYFPFCKMMIYCYAAQCSTKLCFTPHDRTWKGYYCNGPNFSDRGLEEQADYCLHCLSFCLYVFGKEL